MGSAISSSAAAAAESLADDTLLENDTSTFTKAEANQKELNDKWENHRQELIEYKKNHNTYFVSMEANKKLARWADNQRQFYRRGEMNENRQRLLQEIGFFDEKKPQRSPVVQPKLWEENRQALIAYKEKHGTFFVSQQTDKRLSRWAENQRQCHRRGEMNQERQQLLQEIGFFDEKGKKSPQKKAAGKKRLDEIWEENRQALIANKMEHNGSFSFHPKSKLGRWLENQRRANKLGKLSEKRATLLNEIDIDHVYERREEAIRKAADATWEKTRQELIAYKRKHGNYNVAPKSRLGRWIENQKRAFKLYDMPAERAELMHRMGLFPERPEDMVDGRSTPKQNKKRKKKEEDGGGAILSPARKKRSTAAVRINYNEDDLDGLEV